MKKKKHEHEWKFHSTREVSVGMLFKDCIHCPKRVVIRTSEYEMWQNSHGRSDQFKEIEYN